MSERIKAIIIDDDFIASARLKEMVHAHFPDFDIVSEVRTLEDGTKAINEHNPEIVFLDIELKSGNGFQIFKDFPDRNFEVVITTANGEHALRAIKASALDYILKPVSLDALKEAVKKFWTEKLKKKGRKTSALIDAWGFNLQEIKQIALPTLDGYTIIDTKDILYAAADGSYTSFYLVRNKKFTVSRNLKEYEELLKSSGFFRIHHSYLVNLNHVTKYSRGKASCVELTDGTQLEVAVRRRDDFLKILSSL